MDQEKQNDTFTPENAAPQGVQPETTPPAPQEVQPGTTLPAPQDDPLEIPTAELQEDSSAPSVSLPDPVETALIDDLFAGSSDQDPPNRRRQSASRRRKSRVPRIRSTTSTRFWNGSASNSNGS